MDTQRTVHSVVGIQWRVNTIVALFLFLLKSSQFAEIKRPDGKYAKPTASTMGLSPLYRKRAPILFLLFFFGFSSHSPSLCVASNRDDEGHAFVFIDILLGCNVFFHFCFFVAFLFRCCCCRSDEF